jgi:hypothetical protein
MPGGGWRGLLSVVMIGSVAAAGGCGSSDSGTEIVRTKEQLERGVKTKAAMSAQKKLERLEKIKAPMQRKKGGPGRRGS